MNKENPKYVRDELKYEPYNPNKSITYHGYVGKDSYTVSKGTYDKSTPFSFAPATNMSWDMYSVKLNRKKKTAEIEANRTYDFVGLSRSESREYEFKNRVPYDYALRCWKILDKLMKMERTDKANEEFGQRFEMLTHYNLGKGKRIKDTLMERYEAEKRAEEQKKSDEEAEADISYSTDSYWEGDSKLRAKPRKIKETIGNPLKHLWGDG